MQKAEKFWDKASRRYAKSPVKNMEAYNRTMERTKFYLSKEDDVLEVGCGAGSTALLLADQARRITATDISSEMIRIAEDKAKAQGVENAEFICAEIFEDALGKGPFDVALPFNLLHLVEDAPAAIRRIRGLLKPGGLFISKTVCLGGHSRLLRYVIPAMQAIGLAPYVSYLTAAGLASIIREEGFEIIETGNYPAKPPRPFIVAKKV
ncbi:class I SAM-dependent methyltransferase [Rhizobiales bacterium]|uniref:class I SAM-dependent methyltransferase n=1 Tax=Hongsoonwoonella zoysiae TaxID=2821844 RepID=UPI001560DF58|nr:class I SAM-dependent methyltransferase [Hongsoonwoonella zoysiae]NRG19147.1 class I SAM-dependent methyltransferase [Hongsoonwoonella zoysiae]